MKGQVLPAGVHGEDHAEGFDGGSVDTTQLKTVAEGNVAVVRNHVAETTKDFLE